MMSYKTGLAGLVFGLMLTFSAQAHDPNLSTLLIQRVEGVWVLKIDFVPSSIENCWMEDGITEDSLQSMSEAVYKSMLSDHFKSHLQIMANGEILVLGSGGMRFHSHNAQLLFSIPNYQSNWETFEVQRNFCTAQTSHQSVIRVFHSPEEEYKAILKPSRSTAVFLRAK